MRRALLALAFCCGVLGAELTAVPTAGAYTYVLRPDATTATGMWLVTGGSTVDEVLRDGLLQPAVPDTGTGYIEDVWNSTAEVGLGTVALRSGENVTLTRGWAYFKTGSARGLETQLRTGATTLASRSDGALLLGDWRSLEGTAALTQAEVDDLRIALTTQGVGATTPVTAYASYVELHTDLPPPAPTITSAPPAIGSGTTPSWSFTASPAAGFQCRLERPGVVVSDWSACSSPRGYDLAAEPDAQYTFSVRAVDDLGVAGAATTSTYTLDRVAPDAPTITAAPASPTKDPLAAWSFTAEAGAFTSCRLTRGATVVSDWTLCTSPASYDLSSHVDGTYTFEVHATDMAGNVGADASSTFTLDRTPPDAPVITAAPPATGSAIDPSWSFTAETGAAVICRLERGGTAVVDWSPCSGTRTYDLAAEPDGTYMFRVLATDPAGNAGPEATGTYTLDRVAPDAPSITAGPTGVSTDDTPEYAFSAESGASTACRIERSGFVVSDWAPCVSPRSYDLTLQPDADYTFSVRATDAAGNTGAAATRTYTLDRTAPAAPVLSGPSGDSNDDTPVWSFAAEPGATTACRFERGTTVVNDWAACTSPIGFDLTADVDAKYTLRVRATDAAGNTGTEGTISITLDRVAPPAPLLTATPGAPTNDATPTWEFTTSDATGASCRLERGSTVVSDWAACSSPRTYDLGAEADGTYTFRVRAHDAAGNVGPETADSTVLDRSAPAAPTIDGGPSGASSDATPAFGFTAEAGAATACRLERGSTVVSDWTACSSPTSYDLTAEADGDYTFRVRATDAAGNTGPEATRTFTLDRVAPPAPTLTDRPPAATNDDTPTWAWTVDPDVSAYRCRLERGATVVSDWAICTTPTTYDLRGELDGVYTFRVRGSDTAGNSGTETTDSFALDREAPPAPTITAGPTGDSADATPTYEFSAEAGATTACRVERGTTAVSDWAACTSPRSYDLAAEPDGDYTFRVRATDAAGNTGAEATRAYTLDRTAPAAPTITSGPTGASADDTPTYAFAAETGASTACRIERGTTVVSDWAACSSPRSYDLTGESDGDYTFRVRATDAAGNTGADATLSYTLDRAAPGAPTITGGPAADSTDDTPAWSFTAEAGATTQCRLLRGTTEVDGWRACKSPASYDLTAEPDGTYTFAVRATDAAGNTGAEATSSYTLDRAVPLAPTIDARPGDQGNDRSPTWEFSTTETGRFFECRLTRGSTVVSPWGACTSPRTYDLLLEPDDTYTFAVRTYNRAGTRSDAATDTYRLDTAAPAAPTISGGPAPDSTDDTPSWSLTAEPGASLTCRLERGAIVVSDWTPCTSPAGYDLTAEPDGTYTFRARATDAAGNTGDEATTTYTLDRTVPAEPVLGDSPPPAGSDPAPSWSFTVEPDKTAECRVSRGSTVLREWSACTSPLTLDLAAEPDGTYIVELRAVNAAGTRSAVTTDTYDLDRVDPVAPVITDAPPADSSDATPTWSFTAEAGASFACRVERGATVVSDWAACSSPHTQDLGGEPDGTYTFLVRATDAAGNTGPEATDTFTLDRTVPGAPEITARPGSPGADRTPEWSFTGEPDRTFECRLTRGGAVVAGWAACVSPHVYDLAAEPDGTYTFAVRLVNAAGTAGPEVTDDYVLDTTAPDAPVITGSPGDTGNASDPRWTFTAEDGAALACRLELEGAEVRPWAACTSPRDYGLAGEPDGTYTFSVRATDAAGNTGPAGTHVHVLDRVPPAPPAVTAGPGPLGNGRAPAWAFTGEAGAALQCRLNHGDAPLGDWSACQSPRGFDLAGQPDGPYAFVVHAVDAAGNAGAQTVAPYELDTTPGAVQILSGPGPLRRLRTPEWTFAGDAEATFECRLSRREAPVVDWQPCTTPRGFDLAGLPDGVFRFAARATDLAGNLGPVADTDYELDTTPPASPSIDRRPASPGEDRSPTWRFSGETGASFACRVERGSAAPVRDWAPCASPFTADLLRSEPAQHRLLVRATDAAGNTGAAAASAYELRAPQTAPVDAAPAQPKAPPPPASADSTVPQAAVAGRQARVRASKRRRAETVKAQPPRRRTRRPPALTRRPKLRRQAPAPAVVHAPKPRRDGTERPSLAARALRGAANVVLQHPDKSVFPVSLILLVLGFLAVQNRIDRSDPKLALAPVLADPDVEFPPEP